MKTKSLFMLIAIFAFAFTAPAFAQSAKTESTLESILAKHRRLAANPSLVNNPTWQKEHPDVYAWFKHHPRAMAEASRRGAWEPNGTWHEPDWWYRNNPNWVYQNRQDWIQQNPQWRQSGDWDDRHEWHDRGWWARNNREWAEKHHPEWAHAEEEEHEHQGPPYGKAKGHYKKHHDHDHDHDHD